jgi:hypothetical protein
MGMGKGKGKGEGEGEGEVEDEDEAQSCDDGEQRQGPCRCHFAGCKVLGTAVLCCVSRLSVIGVVIYAKDCGSLPVRFGPLLHAARLAAH